MHLIQYVASYIKRARSIANEDPLTIAAGRKCLVIITEPAGSVRNGETTKNAKRGAVGYVARVDFLA
jgi:hypothetical protein